MKNMRLAHDEKSLFAAVAVSVFTAVWIVALVLHGAALSEEQIDFFVKVGAGASIYAIIVAIVWVKKS